VLSVSCGPASNYDRLIISPDRATLLGPAHARQLTVLGALKSGMLEVVSPSVVTAVSDDPHVVTVSSLRLRAVGSGSAHVTVSAQGIEQQIAVDVLSLPPPFIQSIVSERRGKGDGFGRDRLPDVILGPPQGGGEYQGSTDVLSLGVGGAITVSFLPLAIYDGPGADLIVFENPFRVAGGDDVFAEPGIVSVSLEGTMTSTFACDAEHAPYAGCAGVNPVIAGPMAPEVDPTDPVHAGGDAFDLASHATLADWVSITDAGHGRVSQNTSGFDLDAIAVVHAIPRDASGLSSVSGRLELSRGRSSPVPRFDVSMTDGRTLAGIPVLTSMSPSGVLSLDGEIVHAVEAGTATLTARAGPLSASITIEVRP
jgi:hypothetical protein